MLLRFYQSKVTLRQATHATFDTKCILHIVNTQDKLHAEHYSTLLILDFPVDDSILKQ